MDLLTAFILIVSGMLCAIVNVIGGGGSLLVIPVLLMLGLPAEIANGTNRVAIFFQDSSSLLGFSKKKDLPMREGVYLAIPIVLGAIAGAWLSAIFMSETLLNIIVLVLVVAMLLLMLYKPEKWLNTNNLSSKYKMTITDFILFLAIGFYGGFIQVSFTYLVMVVLVLRVGNSMVQSDALKIFLNLLITIITLGIFMYHGQINWLYGICMGIGGVIGGFIGTRFAIRWKPSLVRILMITLLLLAGAYTLFFRIL